MASPRKAPHPVAHSQSVVVGTPFAKGLTRGLYLGTAGDVTVQYEDLTTQQFLGLSAGIIHPIACIQVTAVVTAANLVACY